MFVLIVPGDKKRGAFWITAAVAAVLSLLSLVLFTGLADGAVMTSRIEWMPQFGLNIVLRLDGLAWLFAVLITCIGFLVVIYARYYMSPNDPIARFYALLLAFMGAMLGLVLSGNIIQLAIFWELTSLVSFLLIGYWYHRGDARDGARMALIITGTGGLANDSLPKPPPLP